MKQIEPLVITYFDERADLDRVALEAKVAEWDDTNEFMELDARLVLDRHEARKLSEWINKWLEAEE